MTKRDLVVRIADETGLIQQDVYAVIQKTLDYIVEDLAKGENVEFRNFGVFEVRERKQRIGRNPNAHAGGDHPGSQGRQVQAGQDHEEDHHRGVMIRVRVLS